MTALIDPTQTPILQYGPSEYVQLRDVAFTRIVGNHVHLYLSGDSRKDPILVLRDSFAGQMVLDFFLVGANETAKRIASNSDSARKEADQRAQLQVQRDQMVNEIQSLHQHTNALQQQYTGLEQALRAKQDELQALMRSIEQARQQQQQAANQVILARQELERTQQNVAVYTQQSQVAKQSATEMLQQADYAQKQHAQAMQNAMQAGVSLPVQPAYLDQGTSPFAQAQQQPVAQSPSTSLAPALPGFLDPAQQAHAPQPTPQHPPTPIAPAVLPGFLSPSQPASTPQQNPTQPNPQTPNLGMNAHFPAIENVPSDFIVRPA